MTDLALTPASFREVAAHYATGVVIVSTIDDGFDHAMTATSFTTVSLDPMQILICVESDTRFRDALVGEPEDPKKKEWAISILPSPAQAAASWLATKGRPLHGQFDRIPHTRGPHTGAILIDGALATIEARTCAQYPSGDHIIVVGEVLGLTCATISEGELGDSAMTRPLVYWARRYRGLAI